MTPKNLTIEEERTREIVATVVSKYSTRNLAAMLVASFVAGTWATKMQLMVNANKEDVTTTRQEVSERVKEWSAWRSGASTKLNETRWIVDNHEVRITTLEKTPK